jgi:starch-binding outer membrane protein, SusD/RagB family
MNRTTQNIIIFLLIALILSSCKKDFLDENPRTDLIIPATLPTCQAILDDDFVMNSSPNLGELSSDNFYMTDQHWATLSRQHERNSYTWERDIFRSQQNVEDWSRSYAQILNANVVIEGLGRIAQTSANRGEWNYIKGSAQFFRANAYYNLAQIFAPVYEIATANSALGLPIRTKADINDRVDRSTVKQTYDSILNYLDDAETLISTNVQYSNKNRPSKPAVLALKARVYLSMRDYAKAGEFADKALQLYDSLIDYNSLDIFSFLPFTIRNRETIFQSHFNEESQILWALSFPDVIIDSTLLKMYEANDLRSQIYYTNFLSGQYNLKGGYSGLVYPFTGLATDELYLIRAEANAFANNIPEAMNDINTLLENRYMTGTYTPPVINSREEALKLIRDERRKELAFRGQRWPDLRRFNIEGENITLSRVLNSQTHTLPPNSKLYTLPLPPEIITLGKLQQNER